MGGPANEAKEPTTDGATAESAEPTGDTNVDTGGGDAVINEAPDGGGVDEAPDAGGSAAGDAGADSGSNSPE